MKKLILFLIILLSVNMYAYDWAKIGAVPSPGNDSNPKDNVIALTLNGNLFYIENEKNINDKNSEDIKKIVNQFYAWEEIKIQKLKILVTPSELIIAVYPEKFQYNKTNLIPYVSSGLLFSYRDNILRYDFRIARNNIFMKLAGVFLNEKLFSKKVYEAVKDPQSFIKRRDADFFLARLDKVDEKFDRLEARIMELEKKNANLENKLTQERERVNTAMMAFQNDRFMYNADKIPVNVVKEVIRIKEENPKATIEDVSKKLKSKKIEYNDKQIEIIFAVYYNEFAK